MKIKNQQINSKQNFVFFLKICKEIYQINEKNKQQQGLNNIQESYYINFPVSLTINFLLQSINFILHNSPALKYSTFSLRIRRAKLWTFFDERSQPQSDILFNLYNKKRISITTGGE